jgi:L-asparaginase
LTDRGPVGSVDTGHVNIFAGCGNVAYGKAKLPISPIQSLPKVDIITPMPADELVDAAVVGGVKGFVIAGVGNGNFTKEAFAGLRDARKKGAVVVRSTRLASGFATRNAEVDDSWPRRSSNRRTRG